MYGFTGKLLRIDLNEKTVKAEMPDKDKGIKFLGGRGLGTKILMEEVDPKVDALSPENKLIFITGPLTGTPTPTGGRYMVVTKSPITGTVACSNSGGYWGAELKNAGLDGIIFEGKSDKPVYLYIEDDRVEIRHLWGMNTTEAAKTLEAECAEKARVCVIGPAGEKLSRMAAIMSDYSRAAGRSGVGAVMGSKNLKGIVVRGTGQGLPTYGTAVLVNIINENGVMPTNNFQKSYFGKAEEISGEPLSEKYLVKKDPCYRGPIACGRYCKVDDIEGGGPEYETVWCFGSDCGVSDMGAVIKANY